METQVSARSPAPHAGPSTPAISVVMPVHNGERFLGQAIDSILGQSLTDLELIAVDDGSSDGTPAILAERARLDPRLRVLRLDRNLGVTGALNAGCRLALAGFIARMDADDVSVPARLETQLSYLLSHPDVAVVGSWAQRIDDRGTAGAVQRYPADPSMVAWSMAFFNSVVHPTVMMRREALRMDEVYTSEYPRAEDYALFAGLTRTTTLANIPKVLLHYRMWSGNSSRNAEQEKQAARVVRDHARALGVNITEAEALGLQGLARDRYPSTVADTRRLAGLIVELRSAVIARLPPGASASPIDRDAAVRIWLLAALAARRSPALAVSLAGRALSLSPAAAGTFLAKVVSRLRHRG